MLETLPSLAVLGTVLLLTGALAGFAAGLLGVGGGIIIVPILYTAFELLDFPMEVTMHAAVGTSLATIIPTSISSAISHNQKKAVDWKLFKAWLPWIVCGCLAGTWLANTIVNGSVLTLVFGCVAFIVAIDLVTRHRSGTDAGQREDTEFKATWIYRITNAPISGSIGVFSSLMGIGGGTLSVPILNALKFPIHRAVGTSAVFGLVIAVPATVGYIWGGWNVPGRPPGSLGFINGYGFLVITIMSAMFAPIGARTAHAISATTLRFMFAGFLLMTSLRMLVFS